MGGGGGEALHRCALDGWCTAQGAAADTSMLVLVPRPAGHACRCCQGSNGAYETTGASNLPGSRVHACCVGMQVGALFGCLVYVSDQVPLLFSWLT
jgi:hypothetical protein